MSVFFCEASISCCFKPKRKQLKLCICNYRWANRSLHDSWDLGGGFSVTKRGAFGLVLGTRALNL